MLALDELKEKEMVKEGIKMAGNYGKVVSKFDGFKEHTDSLVIILVFLILCFVSWITIFNGHIPILNWTFEYEQSQKASFVGIAAFVIPIILALSRRFNLAARFGSGEVRKAIVISLTIVYIIMLSAYFYKVTLPLGARLNESLSNSSPVSLPVTSALLQNISPVSTMIPGEALKDITTNFFWVYAVIIVFYFGSRAWESVAEANMVKDLKDLSPVDLAQRRYVLGMMSPENYEEITEKLEAGVVLVDVMPAENKGLKDADRFNLIVKNLGNEDRMVNLYRVNDGDPKEIKPPAKVSAKSYGIILADVIKEKEAKPSEYKFRITADKGADSTFKVSIPQN